ncbi:MAG: hypothetical protein AAGF12_01340 [Myxococcota bacterium]
MRFIRLLVCAAALALLLPTAASAQEGNWSDKSGTFGIGYTGTLGGQNGINARYFFSNLFGIDLTLDFGLEIISPDMGDSENVITFGGSLYVVFKVAYWDKGSLGIIGGFDVELISDSRVDDLGSNFAVGLGLQGEWFPTEYLSLFAQGGLRLDILTDQDANVSPGVTGGDISGVALDLGADLFGQFGFTVWFN